ncbi:hypothetical protein SteCoe_30436 [Stentor coeruleus]|uniref:Uncharacterized protein n=1 Tax=Stentor coeruleus TaxID=5963 RepID=A0A1R2B3L2_9CILI|nr:hypothetical protein SteCoe_30436 [Stentor coeruleus]
MLSRALALSRSFSAAPYNPLKYLQSYVPTKMPSKQEVFDVVNSAHSGHGRVVQNLRHINPIRQSGPIPAFDGPVTMEDILNNSYQEYLKVNDICYPSVDAEEIMRRVPGVTREEAEYIRGLGLTPDDEIEIAYWYKNSGLDIYYPMNNTYIARQVITNSKGEKTECVWPFMGWEDCTELNVDTALQDRPYQTIRHWEAYSGDEWYKYVNNQDLGLPDTWFEYDKNTRFVLQIIQDQLEDLPDKLRPWPSIRNPNARRELWQSQEHMQYVHDMKQPDWNKN